MALVQIETFAAAVFFSFDFVQEWNSKHSTSRNIKRELTLMTTIIKLVQANQPSLSVSLVLVYAFCMLQEDVESQE